MGGSATIFANTYVVLRQEHGSRKAVDVCVFGHSYGMAAQAEASRGGAGSLL